MAEQWETYTGQGAGYKWGAFQVQRGSGGVWYAYHVGNRLATRPDAQAAMEYCEQFAKKIQG